MRFAHPQMLWLLLVTTGLLTWFLVWAWRKKETLVTRFVQARLLPRLTVNVSRTRDQIRLALLVGAVVGAFLALTRPQWGFEWEEARQRGLDIVVAIDTSRSMLARDVSPNRLRRAQLAALDLLKKSRRDRLGLVAFAGTAFLQCPLTLDDEAFRQSIEALDVNIIPQGGTAIAEAIETALTAYKAGTDNFKILVLITDGEDHDSGALAAAEKATKAGLKVFTLGVGTPNGEILQVTDEQGRTTNIKDPEGNVVKSRLNESLLQQIASVTAGFYLPLRAANAIDTLYEKGLAPLPKSDIASKLVRQYHERYYWPLALAVLLLITETLLATQRAPRERHAAVRSGAAVRSLTVLLLCVVPGTLLASPASARRLYERGRFDEALREYERLIAREAPKTSTPVSAAPARKPVLNGTNLVQAVLAQTASAGAPSEVEARLHFNAGDAAYKADQVEDAIRHFAVVTAAFDLPLQQRAYYNLANAFVRRGERSANTGEKTANWQTAVELYANALALDPRDADATFNRDLVRARLEELARKAQEDEKKKGENQEPSEALRKAKELGDEAVRQNQYRRALEIMEQALQRDASTNAYQDYVQRLKEVTNAESPDQP